jgi:hypothetical protein
VHALQTTRCLEVDREVNWISNPISTRNQRTICTSATPENESTMAFGRPIVIKEAAFTMRVRCNISAALENGRC